MKKIFLMSILLVIVFSLNSCDWLPLQTNEKYNGKALDPYTGMSCLEFIETKIDENDDLMFTNMREAISICGLEEYYTQSSPKYTYLLLDNSIITDLNILNTKNDPSAKEALTNFLLVHIIQGEYHAYGTLSYDPTYVISLYQNANFILSLNINRGDSRNSEGRFDAKSENIKTGSIRSINAYSSNYFFTNGVGHVMGGPLVLLSGI